MNKEQTDFVQNLVRSMTWMELVYLKDSPLGEDKTISKHLLESWDQHENQEMFNDIVAVMRQEVSNEISKRQKYPK